MRTFNVTAQIYKTTDQYRQTIFANDIVCADDEHHARLLYKLNLDPEYSVLKIYSAEEIFQVAP